MLTSVMFNAKYSCILAILIFPLVDLILCLNAPVKDSDPCTLSYFDLWRDSDYIFTSEVQSTAHQNASCQLKIYQVLKHGDSKRGSLPIRKGESFQVSGGLNHLACDGEFRTGQTRVIFAAFEPFNKFHVARAPKLRSWLLVLLRSIHGEGKPTDFSYFSYFNKCN